jgi:hypothetical protein
MHAKRLSSVQVGRAVRLVRVIYGSLSPLSDRMSLLPTWLETKLTFWKKQDESKREPLRDFVRRHAVLNSMTDTYTESLISKSKHWCNAAPNRLNILPKWLRGPYVQWEEETIGLMKTLFSRSDSIQATVKTEDIKSMVVNAYNKSSPHKELSNQYSELLIRYCKSLIGKTIYPSKATEPDIEANAVEKSVNLDREIEDCKLKLDELLRLQSQKRKSPEREVCAKPKRAKAVAATISQPTVVEILDPNLTSLVSPFYQSLDEEDDDISIIERPSEASPSKQMVNEAIDMPHLEPDLLFDKLKIVTVSPPAKVAIAKETHPPVSEKEKSPKRVSFGRKHLPALAGKVKHSRSILKKTDIEPVIIIATSGITPTKVITKPKPSITSNDASDKHYKVAKATKTQKGTKKARSTEKDVVSVISFSFGNEGKRNWFTYEGSRLRYGNSGKIHYRSDCPGGKVASSQLKTIHIEPTEKNLKLACGFCFVKPPSVKKIKAAAVDKTVTASSSIEAVATL